tara:strand:+ start:2760 stop:2981 length:222 start_codon:yes stop_codon:yes gene_type:complete
MSIQATEAASGEYTLTRAELMAARAKQPLPPPAKVFVSAQMDEKLAKRLSAYASKHKITRSEAMRRAIVKLLP